MQQSSLFQIENYFVKSMLFELRPGFDGPRRLDEQVTLPDVTINAMLQSSIGAPQRFRCEMNVILQDEPSGTFPYSFSVILVGTFISAVEFTEEQLNSLIKPNVSSVLYSAARELVSSITTRSTYPGFLLPVVSFVDNKEQSAVTESKQLPETKKTPSRSKKTLTKKTAAKSTRKSTKKS